VTNQQNAQKNGQILQNSQMSFFMASAVKKWPNISKMANLATVTTIIYGSTLR